MLARFAFFPALAVVFLVAGCEQQQAGLDPAQLAEHRKAILLAEEPEGAVTPLDLREGDFTEGEVVLVGQIGGIANPYGDIEPAFPWKAGEATLFLVDPGTAAAHAEHTSDPDHAADCPFCAAHAGDNANSVAVVSFTEADGKPIHAGAQQLLEVDQDAVVVVKGNAKLVGELLIVDATGLYVRE